MNRTVKDATTKAFHYSTTQALHAHVIAFVSAYNFAKHLKALRWRARAVQRCSVGCTEFALPCMRGKLRRLVAKGIPEPANV